MITYQNGKGLQKMAKYNVCECCMEAIKNILEGAVCFDEYI